MAKKEKNYDIKNNNGIVEYAMRTGDVFVKSTMMLTIANRIVKTGKSVEISDARGYGQEICVDDNYFFPCEETKTDEVSADE